jgi:hypothetical protein
MRRACVWIRARRHNTDQREREGDGTATMKHASGDLLSTTFASFWWNILFLSFSVSDSPLLAASVLDFHKFSVKSVIFFLYFMICYFFFYVCSSIDLFFVVRVERWCWKSLMIYKLVIVDPNIRIEEFWRWWFHWMNLWTCGMKMMEETLSFNFFPFLFYFKQIFYLFFLI